MVSERVVYGVSKVKSEARKVQVGFINLLELVKCFSGNS